MPVFIAPIAVAIAAIVKAAAVVAGVVGGAIASAAGAVPAPIAAAVAKGVSAVVSVTPEAVKHFIDLTAHKIVETGEKIQNFVGKYKPKEGTPAETTIETANKVEDAKDKADKFNSVIDNLQAGHKSGDSVAPNPTRPPATEVRESETTQRDTEASRQRSLKESAGDAATVAPAPAPVINPDKPDPSKSSNDSEPSSRPGL